MCDVREKGSGEIVSNTYLVYKNIIDDYYVLSIIFLHTIRSKLYAVLAGASLLVR